MVKEYSEIMSSDRYEILEEVDSNVKKFHYIPSDERHAEELKLYTDVKDGLSSLEAELNKFHSLKDKVSANKEERMKQMKTPRRLSDESSPMFDDPNFATHRQLVTVDDCDGGDLLCSTAVGTIVATTAAIDVVLNEIGATLDLFDIVSNSCKHASSCLLIISLPSLTSWDVLYFSTDYLFLALHTVSVALKEAFRAAVKIPYVGIPFFKPLELVMTLVEKLLKVLKDNSKRVKDDVIPKLEKPLEDAQVELLARKVQLEGYATLVVALTTLRTPQCMEDMIVNLMSFGKSSCISLSVMNLLSVCLFDMISMIC